MSAPVNVKLKGPTAFIDGWEDEAREWIAINTAIGGNPEFYAPTIKAAYVIGVIHDICGSVGVLLRARQATVSTYIPAYGVFASAVDLLGRCVRGNRSTSGSTKDLTVGFQWLAGSSYNSVPSNHAFVATTKSQYKIEDLVALRHFATHGQTTARTLAAGSPRFGSVDNELLGHMPARISAGLERYWAELQRDDRLCNNLCRANILAFRDWPVWKTWTMFERQADGSYASITELFNKFDWTVGRFFLIADPQ